MKGGTMYDQEEIVLIPFPYSDLIGSKHRPAIIISNEKLNRGQDRICCLVTSQPSKDGLLIKNRDFKKGKLPFKSWVKPYRLFTIHEKIIRKTLCTVSDNFHDKILTTVNNYLSRN